MNTCNGTPAPGAEPEESGCPGCGDNHCAAHTSAAGRARRGLRALDEPRPAEVQIGHVGLDGLGRAIERSVRDVEAKLAAGHVFADVPVARGRARPCPVTCSCRGAGCVRRYENGR
jgi:hypothetical protein